MAKNLKLTIKNTQLAQALKKGKECISPALVPEETPAPPEIIPPKEIVAAPEVSPPQPPIAPEEAPPRHIEAPSQPPRREAPRHETSRYETPRRDFAKPSSSQRPSTSRFDTSRPPQRTDTSRSGSLRPGVPRPDASRSSTPRPGAPRSNVSRPDASRSGPPRPGVPRSTAPYSNSPRTASTRSAYTPSQGRREEAPRRFLPSVREPLISKEIPQQHQVHKKTTTPPIEREVKAIKKSESHFDSRARQGLREDGEGEIWRRRKHTKHKTETVEEVIRPKHLRIRLPITIKDLASEMKLKATELISKLFMHGMTVTLNDFLSDETTVQLLGHELDCEITIDTTEEERIKVTDKTIQQEIQESDAALLELRPPVVAFMGHVDHGKTSLIDAIRKANVAATEAGAITQHIGAFMCHTPVGKITILDTPGHEAFSAMRERGAEVTDIIVLVIAGDEGMRAQTLEAMTQAKQANVPLVIAINKCDKPNFQQDTVFRQLADHDLLPEAWGGTVITINCSALTGQGIPELLEMLALQSEILELKANTTARARGSVIESQMHKGLGAVATLLVQNGTLRTGDALVFDQFYARVKTMRNEHGEELREAGPSMPVKITGLSGGIPLAGSEFIVVRNEKEAKEIAEKRGEGYRQTLLQQAKKTSMETLMQSKISSEDKKVLHLIIKADVQGSLEALKNSLRKLPSEKVSLQFIHEGIGEVNESDINYAATSKAVILGFHTGIESHADPLIKQTKTVVRLHDIIYHAVDDVRDLMRGLLDKIPEERELGEAFVKAVFKSSQLGTIAGCQVTTGLIRRSAHARILREGQILWKGSIASLKRVKEDVREVQKGMECGILLQGFQDFQENDIIQAYEIVYLEQELT